MVVLALDTTTRAGSLALARDGEVIDVFVGDGNRTHAARLPGDLLDCLARHGLTPADVELFAVASGPGSFTGLRIGIATIQGLAFANARQVVGVSALDALAYSARPSGGWRPDAPRSLVGAWMDARRGEVFAELYRAAASSHAGASERAREPGQPTAAGLGDLDVLEPASVGEPSAVLARWQDRLLAWEGSIELIGDGALAYATLLLDAGIPRLGVAASVPPLAPAMALIAERVALAGGAVPPHGIRPLYVRRPDAELARDRRRRETSSATSVLPADPGAGPSQ